MFCCTEHADLPPAAATAACHLPPAAGDCAGLLLQVAAWRARGRVPLGVDSTASLAETQLRDDGGGRSPPAIGASAALGRSAASASEGELRLQYAMALVRLVNGISDSSQRGRVAASVASLASLAGDGAPVPAS